MDKPTGSKSENKEEVKTSEAVVKLVIDEKFLKKRPLSASSLKAFRKSPKHYIEYLQTPWVAKDEFIIGKAVECILLEPEKFKKKFFLYDNFKKQSDAAKAQWAKMLEDSKANKYDLLTNESFRIAERMVESVKANPECMYYIDNKRHVQRKLNHKDKKTGLPVVGIIDFDMEVEEHEIIVDIKTDYNGEPDKWMRHAADLDYELQVGSYAWIYHKKFFSFPDFMFLVVEKSSPYNSYMVHCPSDYINNAKDEFQNTLLAFKYCIDNDQFHMGYDFWLFGVLPYFTMEKPRYKKSKFSK